MRTFTSGAQKHKNCCETPPTLGLVVCLPEVVVREMVGDFRDKAAEMVQRVEKIQRDSDKYRLQFPSPGIDLKAEVAAYEKRFRDTLEQYQVRVLPVPNVGIEHLLDWGIARHRPFVENGRGIFDALIWASIVELRHQTPNEQFAVITNDKAFADSQGEQIHPDLLGDLGATGVQTQTRTDAAPDDLGLLPLAPAVELHNDIPSFYENWSKR